LARREIPPSEAIYVGNDMLNDVWAASQAGFRTAWFAGDARSCRRREDDPRCRSLRPDLVLTSLLQLLECLDIK
jgi:putative hydrolase of the HAD superfamily